MICDCTVCLKCGGKTVCAKCHQCGRCGNHTAACPGCQDLSLDWTDAEWENLEQLSNTLRRLLENQDKTNKAWCAKLRITIDSIAMYR